VQFCSIVAGVDPTTQHLTLRDALRLHPGSRAVVLDVDGGYADRADVQVLTPADIGVPERLLHAAGLLADDDELRSWLLPHLLAHLVRAGDVAVHLTAGVRVLAPLTTLVDVAAERGFALVARTAALPPADRRTPSTADLLAAGPYREALLAAGPLALPSLEQWVAESDLGRPSAWQALAAVSDATVLPAATLLSRWNLVPGLEVAAQDDGLVADGTPVLAVDLTELDPDRPWLLSTVGADTTRALLTEHPAVREVVDRHAAELAAAAPAADDPATDVPAAGRGGATGPFVRTADDLPVDAAMRRAFRDAVVDPPAGTPVPPDPFDDADPAAFTRWLDEVVTDGVPLTRYLLALYEDRADLRREFPHVPGPDNARFVDWLDRHARHENDYAVALLESGSRTARSAPATAPHGRRPAGLNVAGYLHGELGIGESARLMLQAIATTDVPYSTISVGRHLQSRQATDLGTLAGEQQRFDVTLLCVNADQTGAALAAEPDLLRSRYRIGMWYWEIEDFPATMHGGFGHVDEVWVASDFVREAIARHTDLPVVTVPPPLPQATAPTTLTRGDLGLPEDRTVVLFSFDYLSTAERKNPIGAIEAFRRAFAPGEGPLLVIKSINADKRVGDAERLRLRAAAEPDVLLLEEYLSAPARDALVQHSDVYLSLHRSEGLGLTIAEAMAHGKPVVATAYSGNLQFMTEENAFLVPWTPTEVPEHCEPYPAGSRWAEPDLDAAAAALRQVVDDPALATARGQRAAFDIREHHGAAVAGTRIAARLAEVRAELPRLVWRSRAQRVRGIAARALGR
jgi:glycosyltransferase involved in cell wall biosynthesis